MHNEFVGKRAPRRAAFVCFKPAEEGGEFLLADGRSLLADLEPELLRRLYDNSIRYSVMELPFFGWVDSFPEPLRNPVMGIIKGVVAAALNAKVRMLRARAQGARLRRAPAGRAAAHASLLPPSRAALAAQVDFDVELVWGEGGYDGVRMLQARAPVQPPAVRHPESGEPTWFCNVHSHSSKLRKRREKLYGAERFESGASQINKSDMYYGARACIARAHHAAAAGCRPRRTRLARGRRARRSLRSARRPSPAPCRARRRRLRAERRRARPPR